MADRELKIRIVGDATSAQRALTDTAKAADKVHPSASSASGALGTVKDKLLAMVPGGQQAASALEGVKGAAGLAGGALGGALVGGAVAGATAVVGLAAKGVSAFNDLAAEVDDFQDVAGGSAEQASKMVVTFRELGIESDTGAKGMFKLSREVESGATNLAKYGIEVAKNKDGTTDLNGTLLNVADAYNKTSDQATKNAIAFAAFGKSGTELIDVLEQGRGGIEKFWKSAEKHGEVLSDADIESAKQYRIAMADLGEAANGLSIDLGKHLVPMLTELAKGLSDTTEGAEKTIGWLQKTFKAFKPEIIAIQEHEKKASEERAKALAEAKASTEALSAAQAEGADVTEGMTNAQVAQAVAAKEQAVADHEVTAAEKDVAKAAQQATDSLNRRYDATNKLLDAQSAAINSDMAFRDAEQALSDANQTLAEKQVALNAAIHDHGAKSAEARQATVDLQKAQQDAVGAVVADAEAFVRLREDQAAANGQTLTAQERHDLLRTRLEELANALGPNSPLRSQLAGYINQLKAVPSEVRTDILTEYHTKGSPLKQFASGGTTPGGPVIVGEEGPEIAEFPPGTRIHNTAATRQMLSAGNGPAVVQATFNVTVNGRPDAATWDEMDRRFAGFADTLARAVVTA